MCDYRPARQPPTVDPGQIWFVEHDPARPLSAVDHDALTSANVVIYDRRLAPLVAQVLPIGGYAEPLALPGHATHPAISPRALALAAEGWSVAQLVQANPGRASRLPLTLAVADRLPVRVIAKAATDRWRVLNIGVHELGEFRTDELLTLIFGPFATGRAAQVYDFAVNGLAG
jgi:hypothetical protein